jgi:hypothetical protein
MVSMDIDTIFDCKDVDLNQNFIFVLMPDELKTNRIYDSIIKPVVESRGLTCDRAEDLKTNNAIIQDIVEGIYKARFLIADITDYNINVIYEIGVAHAMKKEVIMIYEISEHEPDFPFDIKHIRALGYPSDPSGGMKLQKDLESTIDYVMTKTISQARFSSEATDTSGDKIGNKNLDEILNINRSQHELRQNRIEYFTYHTLYNFREFVKEHQKILQYTEEYRDNKSGQNAMRIIALAKRNSDRAMYYLAPFTKDQLSKASNFIHSAWLVNKFPDELDILIESMKNISEIIPNDQISYEMVPQLIDNAKYIIQRLEFCINILEDERKKVGLTSLEGNSS